MVNDAMAHHDTKNAIPIRFQHTKAQLGASIALLSLSSFRFIVASEHDVLPILWCGGVEPLFLFLFLFQLRPVRHFSRVDLQRKTPSTRFVETAG